MKPGPFREHVRVTDVVPIGWTFDRQTEGVCLAAEYSPVSPSVAHCGGVGIIAEG